MSSPSRTPRLRRIPGWVLLLAGGVVGALALLAVSGLSSARHQLSLARSSLEAARASVASRDVDNAAASLDQADAALDRAGSHAGRLPLNLLSPIPLVGSPVKALSAGVRAGHEVVAAGEAPQRGRRLVRDEP